MEHWFHVASKSADLAQTTGNKVAIHIAKRAAQNASVIALQSCDVNVCRRAADVMAEYVRSKKT
jgi:hypothetical protein